MAAARAISGAGQRGHDELGLVALCHFGARRNAEDDASYGGIGQHGQQNLADQPREIDLDARATDVANLNYAGAALTGGIKVAPGVAVHLAGGATYNDLQFQVGAYWNGTADNTLLTTHGWTGWGAAGVDVGLGAGASFSAEAFYSPLTVVRPPSTSSQNDGLFNVRGLVTIHLR